MGLSNSAGLSDNNRLPGDLQPVNDDPALPKTPTGQIASKDLEQEIGAKAAAVSAQGEEAATSKPPPVSPPGTVPNEAEVSGAAAKPPSPDALILAQAQQGSHAAFAQLYSLHKRRVYSLCLRMLGNVAEAEDLTQEAFLQLHRKIGTFRGD